ncbi:mono/diheme cytochrome c family protein [Luteibacter rhizovicinus]|uniref:Mono/diheme cytochrome c family protein n=1 Tax=Luteibacter rhizovicinus TaxID=242606 RepID=A0A4V2W3I5_9GAMM|nr:cytochrome c [Luteibacter rhizovicinus]TCV92089.1 mono/diheme cytochrome c family protein [Luteibacter rhizovicinus]
MTIISIVHTRGWILKGLMLATVGFVSMVHAQAAADDALVAHGKAVAIAGDCAACHTDNKATPFAGGRPIGSPLGNIFASNITPSKTNGIGNYTEEQFAAALRRGVDARGRHLYPAMPYTAYAGISDEDMHAMYVYFMQAVPPVDNAVPPTKLSFPYSMRWTMAIWNALYLKKGTVEGSSPDSKEIDRGRYLVDTLGHCSSCHTPRNLLMAERSGKYLGGANVDGWIAPNITSDPVSGIGGWSAEEIAAYLKNGHVNGKGQAGGGMAEAVEQSLRYMPDSDLHAIGVYLKSVPAIRVASDEKPAYEYAGGTPLPSITKLEPQRPDVTRDPNFAKDASSTDGSVLYSGACASCHQPSGKGTGDQYFPSLSHNRAVGMSTSDNLVMAILHGIDREGADMHVLMPAFDRDLNDAQIAAVANYVSQHFGNPGVVTTTAQVAQIRAGGPTPLLLRLTPYLLAAAAIVVLLIVWLIFRRKKSRRVRS